MKTQVIQLDQNEDIVSVRDKMNWSQARRILLVWPKVGHPLDRKLDLSLVARHSASLGAKLALVTQEAQVRENAASLGIPVFISARYAQEVEWNAFHPLNLASTRPINKSNLLELRQAMALKTPYWMEHRATKSFCLSISMLALFILAIFILPSAKISISPLTEQQAMVFDLVADPNARSINYSTGSLPAYTQEVIVEGRDSISATGSVMIPADSATGTVQITNDTSKPTNIPAGLVVATSGDKPVRFISTSSTETAIEPYESVELAVQALQPGPSGNISAYEIDTIEGEHGHYLSVTNPEDITGGTQVIVPSPAQEDLYKIRQSLLDTLIKDALVQLQSSTSSGDILLSSSLTVKEIIDETIFPSVGQPGNDLELSMQIRVEGWLVSGETLQDLMTPIMNSYTPPGYTPMVGTLVTTQVKDPTFKDGKAYWSIRATRRVQASILPDQITLQVRGKTISQAFQQLSSSLPLSEKPDILLTPSWWPTLPFLGMRIQVLQAGPQ